MWRKKKFILPVLIATAVLAGSLGGAAFAADNGEDSQLKAFLGALWDRACEIYEQKTGVTIDQEALKDSIAQARGEIRSEAMQNHLQNLVEQGQITQEQADEFQEWLEAKPDVPIGPGLRGIGGMHGFGGLCPPAK